MRLHAAAGGALADTAVHDTVVASAEGIAERTGVRLVSIEVDDGGVTALVEGDRLAAFGLAAELRRLTGSWYAKRYPGEHLWIEPPERDTGDDDGGGDADDDGGGDGGDGGDGGGDGADGPEDDEEPFGEEESDDEEPDNEETGESRYGIPEFRDPYAFNDEDLLMSHPDVLHDMEIIEENLTDDGPITDVEFPPDDPYWRRKNDPF